MCVFVQYSLRLLFVALGVGASAFVGKYDSLWALNNIICSICCCIICIHKPRFFRRTLLDKNCRETDISYQERILEINSQTRSWFL